MQNIIGIVIFAVFLIIGLLSLAHKRKHGWNEDHPELDIITTYLVILLAIMLIVFNGIEFACSK